MLSKDCRGKPGAFDPQMSMNIVDEDTLELLSRRCFVAALVRAYGDSHESASVDALSASNHLLQDSFRNRREWFAVRHKALVEGIDFQFARCYNPAVALPGEVYLSPAEMFANHQRFLPETIRTLPILFMKSVKYFSRFLFSPKTKPCGNSEKAYSMAHLKYSWCFILLLSADLHAFFTGLLWAIRRAVPIVHQVPLLDAD
jgi:hypothetical protein